MKKLEDIIAKIAAHPEVAKLPHKRKKQLIVDTLEK